MWSDPAMADPADLPEPDAVEGAPHPRATVNLFGQAQAEQDFLTAFNSQRLHHAWLLSGPRGVGKATLAWRIARFLLATPPESGTGGRAGAWPTRRKRLLSGSARKRPSALFC